MPIAPAVAPIAVVPPQTSPDRGHEIGGAERHDEQRRRETNQPCDDIPESVHEDEEDVQGPDGDVILSGPCVIGIQPPHCEEACQHEEGLRAEMPLRHGRVRPAGDPRVLLGLADGVDVRVVVLPGPVDHREVRVEEQNPQRADHPQAADRGQATGATFARREQPTGVRKQVKAQEAPFPAPRAVAALLRILSWQELVHGRPSKPELVTRASGQLRERALVRLAFSPSIRCAHFHEAREAAQDGTNDGQQAQQHVDHDDKRGARVGLVGLNAAAHWEPLRRVALLCALQWHA
eukprot:scaffold259_cov252-Pinguiococcus_pyrenoidosus.AAC.44